MSESAAAAGRRFPLSASAFAALLLALSIPAHAGDSAARVIVLVGGAPLASIAEGIAGSGIAVIPLFPAGLHPRSVSPDREALEAVVAVEAIDGTLLYLKADDRIDGLGLEAARRLTGTGLVTVDISRGIDLIGEAAPEKAERKIFEAALGVDGAAGETGGVVTWWLDPRAVDIAAATIAEALSEAVPEQKELFIRRAELVRKELQALDGEIAAALGDARGRAFVSFTRSWSYFTRRYGLRNVLLTGVSPGAGPGRRSLKGAVARVRSAGAGAVFADSFFPRRPAEETARRAGAALVLLEPFGTIEERGYFKMMRRNVRLISEGLRRPPP